MVYWIMCPQDLEQNATEGMQVAIIIIIKIALNRMKSLVVGICLTSKSFIFLEF